MANLQKDWHIEKAAGLRCTDRFATVRSTASIHKEGLKSMDKPGIIREAEAFARERLERDASGHDWWHVRRVANTALTLAEAELADPFVCELAALLHDVADEKICGSEAEGMALVGRWLEEHGVAEAERFHVLDIIGSMSFKGGGRPPMKTAEGRVVQDADRLDAIGALGIARVFAYSGAKARPIHDPGVKPRTSMTAEEYRSGRDTAINHFYEKLLKLKDLMNTDAARRLAEERHRFLEMYLERFYMEWEGKA